MCSTFAHVGPGDAWPFCRWCRGMGCLQCGNERVKAVDKLERDMTALAVPGQGEQDRIVGDIAARFGTSLAQIRAERIQDQIEWLCKQRHFLPVAVRARLYNLVFPNGLPEIWRARFDDPCGMVIMREAFGREAMEAEFGPGGRGMPGILERLEAAKAKHLPPASEEPAP